VVIFEQFSLSLLAPNIIKLIPTWTITQTMEGALPAKLCCERAYLVRDDNIKKLDSDKVHVDVSFHGLLSSLLSKMGQGESPFFECSVTIVDGVLHVFSMDLRIFNVMKAILKNHIIEKHLETNRVGVSIWSIYVVLSLTTFRAALHFDRLFHVLARHLICYFYVAKCYRKTLPIFPLPILILV
jgi:hypothetical protein